MSEPTGEKKYSEEELQLILKTQIEETLKKGTVAEENKKMFLDLMDKIKGLFDNLFELIKEQRKIKLTTEKEIQEYNAQHSIKRYKHDIWMVGIILIAILLICFINAFKINSVELINSSTIGTLFGGIIGYALGRLRNKQEE